jgi:hypothetical protein
MIFKLSLPSVGKKHSAKSSLPSVKNKTLGKELFVECQKKTLGKEILCRVSKIKHSAKSFFAECYLLPRVFCVALGKEHFAESPKKNTRQRIWHSAKSKIPVVTTPFTHLRPTLVVINTITYCHH